MAIELNFDSLSDALLQINDDIISIVNKIKSTKQYDNIFWQEIDKQIEKQYERLREVTAQWVDSELPNVYQQLLNEQLTEIKYQTLPALTQYNYDSFINSNLAEQGINTIINDTLQTYFKGFLKGEQTLKQLANLTQIINMSEKEIAGLIAEGIMEKGSAQASYKKLKDAMLAKADDGKFITIINKNGKEIHYGIKEYAELVTRTKMQDLNAQAVLDTAAGISADLVQISSHNTSCPICAPYEGQIYSLSGKDKDFPMLPDTTPFHPNSYDEITEIYTKQGWKFIKDLDKKDICLSLNPGTLNLEWANIDLLHKHYVKEMIEFKSKYLNLLVTKDHNMFYQTDYNSRKHKGKFQFIKAIELLQTRKGRFFASSDWIGKKSNLSKDFIEFMGYWLSDGSITSHSKSTDIVSIAQDKTKSKETYQLILKCIKRITNSHIIESDLQIRFIDMAISNYLKQFGKCTEKYIPEEILGATKEEIKIFLDAFIKCDGYKRKRKSDFLGYIAEEKIYFTTSIKMAYQIGELILKVGKRPSFSIDKVKGEIRQFKNGEYQINNDLLRIRECSNRFYSLQRIKKQIIIFNNFAYCVTLNKNHVVYIRRNGQCVWSGNCMHSMSITFREALSIEGTLNKYIEFSEGKIDKPPNNKAFIPLDKREYT